ncbi:DsrE family protein [Compostibacter hankyongensis]|uniref:DsrE family protein n=1 Tax=Compostibacter hankyongensis TaxID=1007089 RepID=A0ABP8G0R6_9BACT
MKLNTFLLAILLLSGAGIFATKSAHAQDSFHGATARLKKYKAIYVLDESDDKKIRGTLRNIGNALNDPRLKGKLEVELIAFGDGVTVYQKSGPYESLLKDLQAKGVILAQCDNTIRERHIDKNTLFSFISYVPSGNGEIIIRQQQGWAMVHP